MRKLAVLLGTIGVLIAPAAAQARVTPRLAAQPTYFHVVDRGNLSAHELRIAEQAIVFQVNQQVSQHWKVPEIAFGDSGTPIRFASKVQMARLCGGSTGCHVYGSGPEIWIGNSTWKYETIDMSHEIIETLLDPWPGSSPPIYGYAAETCDPVEYTWYNSSIGNVALSDFVFPQWYKPGSHGWMDFMHLLRTPLVSTWGPSPELSS